ncbi:MAG: hypothetical protein J6R46_02370, partial [Clostridia bacterium]|nr:hypothetical protein [Clostridia bacterium]
MYSLIMLGIVLLVIGLCAGIAALFGFQKTKIHLIITAACAAVTVVFCWLIKLVLPSADTIISFVQSHMDWIDLNWGANAVQITEQVLEYAAISPTLIEFAIQLVVALALPTICIMLFALLFLSAWTVSTIVFGIIGIVRKIRAKKHARNEETNSAKETDSMHSRSFAGSRWVAAGMGAVQGIIIIAILFIPISCYLSIAQPTINELVAQDVLPADDPIVVQTQDVVNNMDSSFVLNTYRVLGGRALSNSVMSMRVAGMNVKVSEELSSFITLAQQALELSKTEVSNYGEEQAVIINSIGDSFADSKLLAPIVGDIIYAATDAWLNGESFINIERPSMGESGEIMEPMITALLEILHNDAKEALLLQADVKTTAELVSLLARNGVFANLSDTNALLTALSGDAVSSMVTTLGNNNSMKRLIPEIMNLGVRAIGQVLGVPADTSAVHDNFMTTVANTLNDVRELPDQDRIQTLSAKLT